MTETYKPKVGDRVRVTIEGVVTRAARNWFNLGAHCIPLSPEDQEEASYNFEKLSDPEPIWVNGDVIEVVFERTVPLIPHGPRRAAHIVGRWVLTDTGETAGEHFMHNHWPENVKILYKADAQKEAA